MQHFNKHKKPVSGPIYSNSVIQPENPFNSGKKLQVSLSYQLLKYTKIEEYNYSPVLYNLSWKTGLLPIAKQSLRTIEIINVEKQDLLKN